jgi:uncharacterized protein (DUF433 family)
MRFERITVESDKMGGVPCIRGLRIAVALEYAAEAVRERELPLRRGA